MKKIISVCRNVRIFASLKNWSRSLMDRIKDSGSFGLGSNPSEITNLYSITSLNPIASVRIEESTPLRLETLQFSDVLAQLPPLTT